ncbi:hypothetical protein [Streptomyces daliensis]
MRRTLRALWSRVRAHPPSHPRPVRRRLVLCAFEPPHPPPHLRRNPRWGPPLDGRASALVRPYYVAYETAQAQRERRTALALALDGVDVGPWLIHGVPVGGGR